MEGDHKAWYAITHSIGKGFKVKLALSLAVGIANGQLILCRH